MRLKMATDQEPTKAAGPNSKKKDEILQNAILSPRVVI